MFIQRACIIALTTSNLVHDVRAERIRGTVILAFCLGTSLLLDEANDDAVQQTSAKMITE
jgi:imidazoleglycerol phosphate synthase glutamine amidotransferase subunit HisH